MQGVLVVYGLRLSEVARVVERYVGPVRHASTRDDGAVEIPVTMESAQANAVALALRDVATEFFAAETSAKIAS